MPAVDWFRNLGARIGVYGVNEFKGQISRSGMALSQLQNSLEKTRTMFLFMSFGLLAAGGLISRFGQQVKAVFDNMVNSFQQVDYQATVTGTIMNATGSQINDIREHMLQLGRDTEWTAAQAGAAMQRLAMGGFSVHEAMGSANATLQLATIGLTDVTTAANLAMGVYRGFGYEATNATEAADNMSAIVSDLAFAATNSATTVEELGEALKFVASAARMVDWELEEVTAGLMVAADNMVRAGLAGRAMRMSIVKLARAAGIQADSVSNLKEVMTEYGISVTDNEGRLLGMADLVDELNESLQGLTATERINALQRMFGTRATTMWTAMLQEGGDAIRMNTLAMKAAAAKEALYLRFGSENTKMLMKWRQQVKGQGVSIENLTTQLQEFGFTAETIGDIVDVITSDFEGVEEAINRAGIASEITRERLSTLKGTVTLFRSSVDALWASIGQELAPVLMEWNRILRWIADAISKLPKPLLAVIGFIVLLGAVILPLAGKMTMLMGTIMMLTAAMSALVKMTHQEITVTNVLTMSKMMLTTAIKTLTYTIWQLTIAVGKLMLQLTALVFTVMIIQHVFVRFGKGAGFLTMALLGLAWALWIMRNRIRLSTLATGKLTAGLITYTATTKAASVGTIIWTKTMSLANMVMSISPIFVLIGGVFLLAQGMWQLGLAIGWLATAWAILNVVLYASPITYIIMAFTLLIMAILTLLGVSGELEKWFAGKHSFNTVVSSATSGSDLMQEKLSGVASSMEGVRKAGKRPDMFKRKPGTPVGGAAAASVRQSSSTTFYKPQAKVQIEKIETKGLSSSELERVATSASQKALSAFEMEFAREEGM